MKIHSNSFFLLPRRLYIDFVGKSIPLFGARTRRDPAASLIEHHSIDAINSRREIIPFAPNVGGWMQGARRAGFVTFIIRWDEGGGWGEVAE